MALSTGIAPVEKPREQSSEISSERTKIIHRVDVMMTKREIAHILSEIAFYLRLKQDNPYKSLAYERAARALLTAMLLHLRDPLGASRGYTFMD